MTAGGARLQINLHPSCSLSSRSHSPVIDLTVIAAHNVTTVRPLSFAVQLPPPNPFFFSPVSDTPPPTHPTRRRDLPCLLTDNSDRKLLHVITLLKSQFTHPQQIILRWVPGVMETVFSTLHPASPPPAPPKPRRWFAEAAVTPTPPQPSHLHFSFLPPFSFTLGLSSAFSKPENSGASPPQDAIVCR